MEESAAIHSFGVELQHENSRRRKVMLITQHPQHLVSCRSFLMPCTNELLVIFPLWERNALVVRRRLWNKLLDLHWLLFDHRSG